MDTLQNRYAIEHIKVPLINLRQHDFGKATYYPSAIPALAESISIFGGLIHNPQVIGPDEDGQYTVLAGWRRKLAAEHLAWDSMFVDLIKGLPKEDEVFYILESNNFREKTPPEKYKEIKKFEEELPKRQGKKGQGENGEPYDQRAEIAKRMNIAESEVRDLKVVGEHPKGQELLESIDGKNVTLTALARKVKEGSKVDYSGYIPVEEVSLELNACPTCSTHPTIRIEVINKELFFVD